LAKAAPALNFATFLAAIFNAFPVCGLRTNSGESDHPIPE